jgi:alanine racemase
MRPRVEATIDLNALSHNYNVIKNLVSKDTQIMPMVKANAYGHGLIEVAQHLQEADAFGVATLPEAFKLRDSGIKQDLFVMCGFRNADELSLFSELDLTAVVHHPDQVDWLLQASLEKPISVWLKVDTGMHRLGVSPEDFPSIVDKLNQSSNICHPFGIMTHLANADADKEFTQHQVDLFDKLTKDLDQPKSVANSAGILAFKAAHHQLVRPGIMLYGVSPFADKTGADLGLKPAMRFTSNLVAHKQVKKGEYIGYGCTWQADRDLVVGIVTVGYGDGYPRHAQNGTPVMVDNRVCPLVGRVSMDLLAIDISAVPNPTIGQSVVLWGEELPAEMVATSSDTIAYELFCQLTERVMKHVKIRS